MLSVGKSPMRAWLFLSSATLCVALRVDPLAKAAPCQKAIAAVRPSTGGNDLLASARHAGLAALASAFLLAAPPAWAGPTLDEAIVEVSESSYPIIKNLSPEAFGPFSEKVGKLLLDIKPEKLGRSIEVKAPIEHRTSTAPHSAPTHPL